MAIIVTKEIKRKRTLLVVFGVLVLASGAILYFGFLGTGGSLPAGVTTPAPIDSNTAVAGQVSDLKIKILEDDRFKKLEPPPGVPLKTETTGKSNPFSD